MNKKSIVFVILQVLLSLFGLGIIVWSLCMGDTPRVPLVENVSLGVLYAAGLFYLFYGYKIPHADLFRYVLFAFAVLLGVSLVTGYSNDTVLYGTVICVALVAYMSGRLHKISEACALIVAVLVLLLVIAFARGSDPAITDTLEKLLVFNPTVLWAALSIAYLLRFRAHQDIGKTVAKVEE